jgi:polyphenol oxidase
MEPYLTAPGLSRFRGLAHLFGKRGVDSPQKAAAFLGLPEDAAVTALQVHGDGILYVDSRVPLRQLQSSQGGHDALITGTPGILIAVGTADCVPILIADRGRNVIAAVHAGWRGTIAQIAAKVIGAMAEDFGCSPSEMAAGIGPSAGPCCYEVDAAVLEPLKAGIPDWRHGVRGERDGKARLDLWALNRRQLSGAGVPDGQIDILDACTICSPDRFHSYRREGRKMKNMFSGIALRPV